MTIEPDLAVVHELYGLEIFEGNSLSVDAELEAEDFAASPHPPSAQACLADALLTQVEALQHSPRRYRTLVVMQEEWARAAPLSEHSSSS
jgi:hypothetical protein